MPLSYALPEAGTKKAHLPTSALLIDLPALDANLSDMAQFFAGKPAKLRPHFKTHKCPTLAH
jgi:D-serine deaminase-like pyridoxal phosphate-dependent protein